jgi:hypothetical protein
MRPPIGGTRQATSCSLRSGGAGHPDGPLQFLCVSVPASAQFAVELVLLLVPRSDILTLAAFVPHDARLARLTSARPVRGSARVPPL